MNITARDRVNYAIIAGLMAAMFWKASLIMWQKWFEADSYYSHGILIPFVSLYLIWKMRGDLAKIPAKMSRGGLALLVLGLFIRVFGAYTRVNYITGLSLVVIVAGLVLFLLGRKITVKLLFPLLFLIWMVPLPDVVIHRLAFQLKVIAGDLATSVMPYVGLVHIWREGSDLHFVRAGGITDHLRIGDVCSGLRSMIALLAFGSVFAYITRCDGRRRLELFAASIPCSIIANMSRIVVITMIAWLWGREVATVHEMIPNPLGGSGYTLHDATGILIFVVAFIGFFSYEKLLNRPPYRLPRRHGPKDWILDVEGRLMGLAENQLLCLVRAGHVSAEDHVRRKKEPAWRKVGELEVFAQSPRGRKLQVSGSERQISFEECVRMVRERKLSKNDFVSYAGKSALMRAGGLDFLREHWPLTPGRLGLYALLYAALPVVLFFAVWADHGFHSLRESGFSVLLITIVSWFFVRVGLLLCGRLLRLLQPAENPMPLPD